MSGLPVDRRRTLHLLDLHHQPPAQLLGFRGSARPVRDALPSVTRTTEEVLQGRALGAPRGICSHSGAPEWRTVWSVVLPTARSGVVTAVLLGIARIVGETAPLLFTAFGSQIMNANVLHSPKRLFPSRCGPTSGRRSLC